MRRQRPLPLGLPGVDRGAAPPRAWSRLRGFGQRLLARLPNDIAIRPVAVDDLPLIGASPHVAMSGDLHERHARHVRGEETWLVAWWRGRPVGMASVRWQGPRAAHARDRFPDCPEIHTLEVEPSRRSAGIGSRLLAACESLAAGRGLTRTGLAVQVDNVHAYALYLRMGYAEGQRVEYEEPPAEAATAGQPSPPAVRWRFLVKAL